MATMNDNSYPGLACRMASFAHAARMKRLTRLWCGDAVLLLTDGGLLPVVWTYRGPNRSGRASPQRVAVEVLVATCAASIADHERARG